MKIEVCKGQAGIALYVDDERVAGPRHNGRMEVVLTAEVTPWDVSRLHAICDDLDKQRIEALNRAAVAEAQVARLTEESRS